MNLRLPNHPQRRSTGAADVDDEFDDQVGQVEAPVKAVGEGPEVVVGVLRVLECLVGARQHGLEVAQHGVDPLELRRVSRLALADDFHAVAVAGIGDRGKASQAGAEHISTRRQAGAGPLGDGFAGEAGHTRHLRVVHMRVRRRKYTFRLHRE